MVPKPREEACTIINRVHVLIIFEINFLKLGTIKSDTVLLNFFLHSFAFNLGLLFAIGFSSLCQRLIMPLAAARLSCQMI